MNDLVSVVTTLYNYKCFIGDLISSVQKQTYENWELIIVDDASTDNPLEVIEPWLKDSRIRYVRFDVNHGYSFAKNEGIVRSRGEYIAMIDADDLLVPNSLRVRYMILKKFPDKLWCHGKALILGGDGKVRDSDAERRESKGAKLKQAGLLVNGYHHRLIHPQTIMVCSEFHKRLGLYDESLRFSSDNEMFRRAIQFSVIPVYCCEFVSIYRGHSNPNRMSRSKEKKENLESVKKYICEIVERRFREGIQRSNTRLFRRKRM